MKNVILCALSLVSSTALGGSRFQLGNSTTHGGIAIFPILKPDAVDKSRYLTLEEAQNAGVVRVTERGNKSQDARVEEVYVSNMSARPLYLVGGEVILGGKQDRVIREDSVIPPLSANQPIKVFCVEHGRWAGGSMAFRAAPKMIDVGLREEAALGTQGGVWNKVAQKQKSLGVALLGGGSYRGVIDSKAVGDKTEAYVKALQRALGAREVVGMVVAVGGRITAVDLFQSPSLFARFRAKLLQSYAVQAIESGDRATAAPAPSRAEASAFLADSLAAKPRPAPGAPESANRQFDAAKMKGTERLDKDGSWLHKTYFKKY